MNIRAKSLVVLLFSAAQLFAAQHDHAEPFLSGRFGTVSFPTTCKPTVQAAFERGIALLHSFGYDAAKASFQQIEVEDPACAMAYWGHAMSLYHQLWDRPSKSDLADGFTLIQKAQSIQAVTERERAYIQAAAAFYVNNDKVDYEARVSAYLQSLINLHDKFPGDDEAGIFYALALLASPQADKNDFAYRKRAVALLNPIFLRRPDHPGVAHYLIHACDNPEMAKDALPAARRYAKIAPASAHAVHMPSHIFARLGLWQDDVQSNLASKALAEQQHAGRERMHAMQFLEYAYLQLGEWDKAKAIETEALTMTKQDFGKDGDDFFFFVQVNFPSLYDLETKAWKDASLLPMPVNAEPDFQARIYWARTLGAAHLHDSVSALDAVKNYDAALAAVRKSSYAYVADQMKTDRDEAHAWAAFAAGQNADATQILTSAADQQDQTGKPEVAIPAREMLADMLMELNRPDDALSQYKLSLKTDPNRFNSLLGAAHASKAIEAHAK